MENKKIFLVSYGVGGTEEFQAIYYKLKSKLKPNDIKVITITKQAKAKIPDSIYVNEENIISYILYEKPDCIINERSNGLALQNKISEICKKHSIFNICLLDFYGSYDKRFISIPDIILSPSKTITNELISFGIKKEIIITTGNPAFDRFSNYKYRKIKKSKDYGILFISQPLEECGYANTQYEIFRHAHTDIKNILESFTIYIKLHPNESEEKWIDFCKKFNNTYLINFDNSKDFLKNTLNYDLIVGYNSTLMVQTAMIGVPTVFYEYMDGARALTYFKSGENLNKYVKYTDFEKNAVDKTINAILQLSNKY